MDVVVTLSNCLTGVSRKCLHEAWWDPFFFIGWFFPASTLSHEVSGLFHGQIIYGLRLPCITLENAKEKITQATVNPPSWSMCCFLFEQYDVAFCLLRKNMSKNRLNCPHVSLFSLSFSHPLWALNTNLKFHIWTKNIATFCTGTKSMKQTPTRYSKQPCLIGCFSWMIPNLYK